MIKTVIRIEIQLVPAAVRITIADIGVDIVGGCYGMVIRFQYPAGLIGGDINDGRGAGRRDGLCARGAVDEQTEGTSGVNKPVRPHLISMCSGRGEERAPLKEQGIQLGPVHGGITLVVSMVEGVV